jgi:outer membrane murein-binding lipoprotein Lpp
MPEFVPLRTGAFVIRQMPSWRRRAVLIVGTLGVLIALYLMYEWGRFEGGYSKFAEIQQRRELNAKIESLQEENERLRAAVAAAELDRKVENKAYADVEKNLADLQAQVLKHREQLTFYRGIVSPEDGIGGLRIQRFQVLPGAGDHQYRLRLVLVQSMRQESVVSGSVVVQLEGVRENRPVQLSLSEAAKMQRADGQLPFQFRYFQNLEQDIVLPDGFEPRAVTVEVRSPRMDPVRESYPWRVQTEA